MEVATRRNHCVLIHQRPTQSNSASSSKAGAQTSISHTLIHHNHPRTVRSHHHFPKYTQQLFHPPLNHSHKQDLKIADSFLLSYVRTVSASSLQGFARSYLLFPEIQEALVFCGTKRFRATAWPVVCETFNAYWFCPRIPIAFAW